MEERRERLAKGQTHRTQERQETDTKTERKEEEREGISRRCVDTSPAPIGPRTTAVVF